MRISDWSSDVCSSDLHGHRHAHLVERDAGEQGAHVEDRVDRHPGHADVAGDPRMVAVVAAVRGQVESHRQPLLPGRQVAAVEGVAVLGRGEAGILPDGPGLRSEEHTSELQSLMSISYAVFCLKKKTKEY